MARSLPEGTRGAQTRDRILQVALPLFAQHGYAGTSVRSIAGAAQVNVATLAYHFEDKEGLYLTVVQHLHEQLQHNLPAVPPAAPDPAETIHSWVEMGWRFVQEHLDHVRILVRHVLDTGALPPVILDRWSQPALSFAEELVGVFRPGWSSTQRRLLVVSMMHLIVRLSLEDPDQLAQMAKLQPGDNDAQIVDWLTQMLLLQLGLPAGPGEPIPVDAR